MNHKEWSTKKFWAIVVGVFILGYLVAPKQVTNPKEITKEVVRQVPATCDYSGWKELKTIDDTGFGYCADFATLASEGFGAVSRLDVADMQRITNEIESLNVKIGSTSSERQRILSKLGY